MDIALPKKNVIMKRYNLLLSLCVATVATITTVTCSSSGELPVAAITPSTYCNPMDLSYRFMVGKSISRREAADPTMVLHNGTYYLFASKTGGYWWSEDMRKWELVVTDQIPTEDYAPTAISMRDTIFFVASSGVDQRNKIYKSADPKSGEWEVACEGIELGAWDPCFFQDDDERLYFYWGCSNYNPMYGVEMDPYTFKFIDEPKALIHSDYMNRGWEISGDYNTRKEFKPWIEGAWVNKHEGKYYYQYAGPDACYKSYCDAVMVSDSPLGEFTLEPHNPFAYKPEGFACGAGHGSTFEDKHGNLWHVGSVSVSVKDRFERRLAMFPTFFDQAGNLYSHARFGDYPTLIPTKRISSPEEVETGWMLLSYDKSVEVSSHLEGYPASNMTNEDIRTYWSASSGDDQQWALIDLGTECEVRAIQVNFAEQDTDIHGRQAGIVHRYTVESSCDKSSWHTIDDQSQSTTDNTNNYIELSKPLQTRYIRVNNIEVPDGKFAISGLRVFGLAKGSAPAPVEKFEALRNPADRRDITLKWAAAEGAIGYNISYGVDKDMLYHNYMVYDATEVEIRSLSATHAYYFTIEPFNECGTAETRTPIFVL
ncbi:MAG: family 43 glycosylhydrolase [Rikenellaceae bacterium]